MRFKRLLALLLAAALALSLLAGCGGGKALSQVIVDLLDNLYSNVSVEADSDLTAALKQAAAEGGTEEEILSRMIEILNHKGGSITFTRLGSGQQGEHGVTLYFQPGTDPDAAARNALAQWAGTLGTLPDDGSYQADVAMIETENGYYIALDVEVLKAGKPDKPDKDDDPEPEPSTITGEGFTYNKTTKEATISEENGLEKLLEELTTSSAVSSGSDLSTTLGQMDITLTSPVDLPADWPEDINFTGTLTGNGNIITMTGTRKQGLFDTIARGAIVKDVTISNSNVALLNPQVGLLAGSNEGTIQGCFIKNGRFSSSIDTSIQDNTAMGFLVGQNRGEITDCTVTDSTFELTFEYTTPGIHSTSIEIDGTFHFGGLAGDNYGTIRNSSVSDCTFNIGNRCSLFVETYCKTDIVFLGIGGAVGYNDGTLDQVTATLPSSIIQGGLLMSGIFPSGAAQSISWIELSLVPQTKVFGMEDVYCIAFSFGHVAGYDVQKESYI